MQIDYKIYRLKLEIPFAIARGTTAEHDICIVSIRQGEVIGYGEASPSKYYSDSVENAIAFIEEARRVLGNDPFQLERIAHDLRGIPVNSPSARAGIEMALYDLVGKLLNVPVFKLLGLSGMSPPRTSITVGVEDVGLIKPRLNYLRSFPIIKAKLGFGDEKGLLELLKAETGSTLRVDANEGLSLIHI